MKDKITINTKKIKKNFKIMFKNFELSFSTGSSILGFILGQFVWIWILKGFLGWFALWFSEITSYQIGSIWQLTNFFWIMYGIWFAISIITRLHIVDYREAKLKEIK